MRNRFWGSRGNLKSICPGAMAPTLTNGPGSTMKVECFLALYGPVTIWRGPTFFPTKRSTTRKTFHDLSCQGWLCFLECSMPLVGHRGWASEIFQPDAALIESLQEVRRSSLSSFQNRTGQKDLGMLAFHLFFNSTKWGRKSCVLDP